MTTIVPAAPGFEFLVFWSHDETHDLERHVSQGVGRLPIVAWAIDADLDVVPITPEGRPDPCVYAPMAILLPNGHVLEPHNREADSVQDWVRHRLEDRERKMEKAA